MFIMGKASKEEIKEIEDMGWEVEKVDEEHFNKALDPNYAIATDVHITKGDKDKMVSVFVDDDMINTFREWRKQEREHRI